VICWHWRGTVFTVDFSFFAVAALVAVRGGALYFLLLFLACLLHELGHLAMLLLFHRHVQTVSLCGAGALFVPSAVCGAYWQDILVSLAGPAVNLLLGTAFLWGDRGSVSGMLHLGLGLFNLLPYARLDGGAVCLRLSAGTDRADPEWHCSSADRTAGDSLLAVPAAKSAFLSDVCLFAVDTAVGIVCLG